MRRSIGFCLASALLVGGGNAIASDMVAVSWTGSVYSIDSTTGTGTLLGHSGFQQLNAMGRHPDGTLYATSGLSATSLIKIDPNTGAGTLVTSVNVNSCRGMAFASNGTCYMIEDIAFGQPDRLYSVDISNGNATLIGSTGFNGIQALAVHPNGTIYAWDVDANSQAGLIILDPNTGQGTDVDPNTPGGGDVQGLAFDDAGQLFGGRESLFSIDLSTGAQTLIGSGGYTDTRGMEFIGGGGLRLGLGGSCPGTITVSWSGATPNKQMGIVFAKNQGNFVISSGPCAGTQLGLGTNQLQLVSQIGTGNGSGQVQGQAGSAACGGFLQLVVADGSPCATSNVAQLP